MSDPERKRRAEVRRSQAIIRKGRLEAKEVDLSPISGPDAVSLVHRLTTESWSLSRREVPRYTRAQIPCRFVPGRLT